MKKQLLSLLLVGGMASAQVFSENFNGGALPTDGRSIILIQHIIGE